MMTRAAWIGLLMGVGILGAAWWWVYGRTQQGELESSPTMEPLDAVPPSDKVVEPEAEPAIAHPMPEPEAGGPVLPDLESSDGEAIGELRSLFGAQPVESILVPREIIRRIVLVVDSLDREPLPLWLRPVRRVPGNFDVNKSGEAMSIGPANTARYAPLMAMIERVDMQKLASAYRRFYPLFQDAYDRLGNPRARYFNDRLISVIDHLLATPVIEEPIALARPKVVYQFADPALEQLSSGQKAMLRIGRENAAKLQARMREFRSAIAGRPPAHAG